MGKNDGASKDDLKQEHVRVVAREQELKQHYDNAKAIFQKLDETYQLSKGSFSLQRYGQLKDMIKGATSEETLNVFKEVMEGPPTRSGKGGLAALVQKAKVFSGEAQLQEQQESQQAAQAGAKPAKSGIWKKLKDVTGFSEEPITDEDVMSSAQLTRDNSRKQRSVQHLTTNLAHAVNKLEQLKHAYEASKSYTPPKRYIELKEMIKRTVAEKLP